ncbi:hypothetical protein PRUPE_8G242300 [Prunus persica]|uniref:Uncharacterized protein n=1 Tax=Prunus persica TaxID=3760 RepID=A0A251N2M4_PRUPE|nr:hypothetical protein PRUPE_8G242300 [Prunus persica]
MLLPARCKDAFLTTHYRLTRVTSYFPSLGKYSSRHFGKPTFTTGTTAPSFSHWKLDLIDAEGPQASMYRSIEVPFVLNTESDLRVFVDIINVRLKC